MTKSVKELIYDYLKNGQEATIANKMRCFNTVQNMFTEIATRQYVDVMRNKNGASGLRVIGPMNWLKQKQAELEQECNPLTKLSPFELDSNGRGGAVYSNKLKNVVLRAPLPDGLGESGGNISQMMGRRRSLKERDVYHYFFRGDIEVREGALLEALYPKLEDGIAMSIRVRPGDVDAFLSTKAGMVSLGTRRLKMKPEFCFMNSLHEMKLSGEPKGKTYYPNVLMSPMSAMRRLGDRYAELCEENFRKEMINGVSEAQIEHNRRILHASIYSQVLHALRETRYMEALNVYCNDHSSRSDMRELDLPEFDLSPMHVGANHMLGMMRSMHEVVSLDYPNLVPSSLTIAGDFDGDYCSDPQENKMKYIVKLMTTELFHNEVVLVGALISRLNDSRGAMFGNHYASEFEEILASMAALGQPSVTLDDHQLVTQLIDGNLSGSSTRLTLTAPTEDNPSVIATFYVAPQRDIPSVPVFAVSITPATEENKDDMKELKAIIDSYHELTRDIAAAYLAGHLPVRESRILKDLTLVPYDPVGDARNSVHGLSLSEVMMTAGKSVEWLLGNSVKLKEYVAALEGSGVKVGVEELPSRSAFWSAGGFGHSAWMIVPMEVEFGSETMPVTVSASEDDLVNYHLPRRYREAEVVINRRKAMSFADNFFGTESAE